MNALFVQLKTAGPLFATYSRRWISWLDDPSSMVVALPLLVQWESPIAENYSRNGGRGMPPIRTWHLTLLAYGKIPAGDTPGVPDATTPAAAVLNPLIDAIETALDPGNNDGTLTLGGLVQDCRIDGDIIKALGDVDPSGICGAIIPVKILVQ